MPKLLFFFGALIFAPFAAADQDAVFLAAREAFRVGDAAQVAAAAPQLQNYVLYPYVLYWQALQQLDNTRPEAIRGTLNSLSATPLADRLRGEWLKRMGKKQDWASFSLEYPFLEKPDAELTCYALQARQAQNDGSALDEAKRLWLEGRTLPASCTPLFDALAAKGRLSVNEVWVRIRLALESGNLSVARQAADYLPAGERLADLDKAADNPSHLLEHRGFNLKHRVGRELAMFALDRLARSQPALAQAYWEKMRAHFSAPDQAHVWGLLAYRAARKHDPVALAWYRKADKASLSDEQIEWEAREALRLREWGEVSAAIGALSPEEQQKGNWRYWKARALKEQGKLAAANAIFAPLSAEANFYGQLADDELGVAMSAPAEDYKANDNEIREVSQLPGIQRALTLYRLNLRIEAVKEWIWTIRGFNDHQLLAAAELARRNEWYDRAINTAEKTQQLHDFSLRFPIPHADVMASYSRQRGLDGAWVYGLIRQESRFIPVARSNVGASGLMQIMPATARWIAKKMGVDNFRQSAVTDLDTNIAFGTFYLKHVLDRFDGQTLPATAAYNAGPGRASRWRDDKPMEGAIYAESIPFSETRDYVQKVMSNAVYYSTVLGRGLRSLKARLGVIKAVGNDSGNENNRDN
ncbi:MAG: transglycosylase SLT domain-containing protein [Sulfuricellaceae bacterium]|nr:transglycosylase SLT domain-containing protein [Sulfuricellaceae bacterium]